MVIWGLGIKRLSMEVGRCFSSDSVQQGEAASSMWGCRVQGNLFGVVLD